jgi:serine/threonine protein kinase
LEWGGELEGKVVDNPVWLAPEIILKKNYTYKVDVYAFGVILWELVSAKDFFGHINFFSELENLIVEGTL